VWAAICPMCRVFLVTELIEAGAAPGSGVELSARELAEKGPLVEVACRGPPPTTSCSVCGHWRQRCGGRCVLFGGRFD
jgi:hypothetical protein